MDSYDSEDSDPDEDDATPVADEARHGWIGVIHIPVLEYYNVRRGSSKSWSVLEKVWAQLLCFIRGMHAVPTNSLRKQLTFGNATTSFPAKWHLRNEGRNSILMTGHYPDLGNASDWLNQISHAAQPFRSTTQIWVVSCHLYGISALIC